MRGRIKIAFDEWNLRSWHHPGFSGHRARKVDYQDPEIIALIKAREKSLEPSLYTMADALFCASFFNACLRNADARNHGEYRVPCEPDGASLCPSQRDRQAHSFSRHGDVRQPASVARG